MMKLVDILDLGSNEFFHSGSSPLTRKFNLRNRVIRLIQQAHNLYVVSSNLTSATDKWLSGLKR